MKKLASDENKKGIEIVEINSEKIIFKTTNLWSFCLNANQEKKFHYHSLDNNYFNYQKLQKIIPNCDFSQFVFKEKKLDIDSPQLRNYQLEDVNFLSKLKNGAIFSEMRTGKTAVALMTFKQWPVNNLLIIVPGILQQQWQKSVEIWLKKPAYIITYLDKNWRYEFYQRILQDNEWIIIVSKDTFKIDSDYFKKVKKRKVNNSKYCVIIDEAHFLRNYQSRQSKSIYVLKDTPYKLALTGTPVVNHHTDVFGILKFLQPEIYSSYWKFAERFFHIHKFEFSKGKKKYHILQVKNFKSEKQKQELQMEISNFSVNRRQKDVLPWLPLIIHQKEYLIMEEEQQKTYFQWKEKWQKYQPLEVLAKLKTLTLYPPALGMENILGSKINHLVSFLKEKKMKA